VSVTWLLALAGLGLALYGLVLFVAFTVAARIFARLQKTGAFARALGSGAVQAGDALAARAIDAIPIGFVRNLIRRRLPSDVSAYGLSMIDERLRGSRSLGGWIAGGGLALFVASFWLGPWLGRMIFGRSAT
jgi:hypothetical protein